MAETPNQRPHLIVRGTGSAQRFTYPTSFSKPAQIPEQDRHVHGLRLQQQLEEVEQELVHREQEVLPQGIYKEPGLYLRLEGFPDFALKFDSLENRSQGIEVVAVTETVGAATEPTPQREEGDEEKSEEEHLGVIAATVFVPEGKLSFFAQRVRQYLEEDTPSNKPKHQALIESINRIGLAKLRDLWTDPDDVFPEEHEVIWWEAWLRRGRSREEREERIEVLKRQADAAGLPLSNNVLRFPENSVVLIKGSPRELAGSVFLLDSLAELRKAKETAEFFMNLSAFEAADWINEALTRLHPPSPDAPAVCLLDAGVTREHPLLSPALDPSDMHSYDPQNWGFADDNGHGQGHGTEMAGLGLYGDLAQVLALSAPIRLMHRLESVKMLPPQGQHDPKLYGDVTRESIARVETRAPGRQRTICMAITSRDNLDRGRPSSWSAAVDELCAGVDDDVPRLMLIASGNAQEDSIKNYPDGNQTDSIHDPGQSWNALTVGAFTDKTLIDPEQYAGWQPLAPRGGLSPSSTTSLTWAKQWPLKPDVVLEGGNFGVDPVFPDTPLKGPDSLRLLTTNYRLAQGPFTVTGDTSGATALAARLAARIQVAYPALWPETVRALMVHSARWTDEMLSHRAPSSLKKQEVRNLLCRYGYGIPNLGEALYDAGSSLTLVVEDELLPFAAGHGTPKTNEMKLHRLPWPTEVLQQIGNVSAELRVTLSYFIEPNPGSRGYSNKFSYASHGLRFDVKTPAETTAEFQARINKVAREELENYGGSQSDAGRWVVGPNLRTRGSIHSDIWNGSAAELATKSEVAVYPTSGWWKTRAFLKRWNRPVRYALIVTLKTESIETDIYTPVANMVTIQT